MIISYRIMLVNRICTDFTDICGESCIYKRPFQKEVFFCRRSLSAPCFRKRLFPVNASAELRCKHIRVFPQLLQKHPLTLSGASACRLVQHLLRTGIIGDAVILRILMREKGDLHRIANLTAAG